MSEFMLAFLCVMSVIILFMVYICYLGIKLQMKINDPIYRVLIKMTKAIDESNDKMDESK